MDLNHYEVLGVPSSADATTIKRAFRSLARAHHPDLGGDSVRFAAVATAWSVLSDPQARAGYDAELAGEDAWGEEVELDIPVPRATRPPAQPPVPNHAEQSPAEQLRAPETLPENLTGSLDAATSGSPAADATDLVDPLTSPPRALPRPDTSGVAREYPRPIGAWALLAYCGAVLILVALMIAFPSVSPVSPETFVSLLALSVLLVGSLVLRASSGSARAASAFSAAVLWLVGGAAALAGAVWVSDGAAVEPTGVRVAVLAASALLGLGTVTLVERRRRRARRLTRQLRRIHDDAAAAARWNALLDRLHNAPEGRLCRASVRGRGRRRPVDGWAVVDGSGAIRAAATAEDLSAWCAALQATGVQVAARR